jgi:hypothetical protein
LPQDCPETRTNSQDGNSLALPRLIAHNFRWLVWSRAYFFLADKDFMT